MRPRRTQLTTVTYRTAAHHLLQQAQTEFQRGDLRQASEKAWGAVAQITKAYKESRATRPKAPATKISWRSLTPSSNSTSISTKTPAAPPPSRPACWMPTTTSRWSKRNFPRRRNLQHTRRAFSSPIYGRGPPSVSRQPPPTMSATAPSAPISVAEHTAATSELPQVLGLD